MNVSRILALAALSVAAPVTASAQYRPEPPAVGYRPGQPAVMTPAPQADPDAASVRGMAAFKRWYGLSKKPALMVFWNRALSDQATTLYAETSHATEEVRTSQHTVGGRDSGAQQGETSQTKNSSQESSKRALTGGLYAALDPVVSSQLESAFQGAWLANGVELVDRTALMRKMSVVANQADRADTQFMESVALEQGVDYLIEVLPTLSASSPTGAIFLVKIKHLPSATVIAQFNTTATPPAGPSAWVATAGGFEKRTVSRTSPETIGAELAIEAMSRFH